MQFTVPKDTRVFLRKGPTDLRLGFDGLRALVVNVIKEEPTSGHLFVFCNRVRNRLRCLFWDGSGLWLPPSAWKPAPSTGRSRAMAVPK